MDFRTVPHWLNAGATQSGKSNLANALIIGLSPQPVALVGFDLKGGVEFTPTNVACRRWPPPAPNASGCWMTSSR
ncbi:FtsK/SpoIIIE domain-containing protein [Streptosporangium lutulentum]